MKKEDKKIYDIAIIGGGINGVALARDAALRGHKVYLCEKGDLAAATSSASSKIIHGGLRYLEQYGFSLVRSGLKEREVLLKIAPHLVEPLGFILPHAAHLRPKWLIRLGLFLYDALFLSRRIQKSKAITFHKNERTPLKDTFTDGFVYHDGWMDDARLVITTAKSAQNAGATIAPRTQCKTATFEKGVWSLGVLNHKGLEEISAKVLINAAGPWAENFLAEAGLGAVSRPLTLVKGSHIVVPKLYDHHKAYLLQTEDGRVVFTFPYQGAFTLIGTTDTPFHANPKTAHADVEEVAYLCRVVNAFFKKPIHPTDVVWSYSGVRPLIDDGKGNASKANRGYILDVPEGLPLMNVWGGKFTTHRKLAEDALNKLGKFFPQQEPSRTAKTPLLGGDIANFEAFVADLKKAYPWLCDGVFGEGMLLRMAKAYGTQIHHILEGKEKLEDLGQYFGTGFYQVEVDYLIAQEWAQNVEDVLWRRTKLGLHLSLAEQSKLKEYLYKKCG